MPGAGVVRWRLMSVVILCDSVLFVHIVRCRLMSVVILCDSLFTVCVALSGFLYL